MKLALAAAFAAVLAMPVTTLARADDLTDPQIAHIAYTPATSTGCAARTQDVEEQGCNRLRQ